MRIIGSMRSLLCSAVLMLATSAASFAGVYVSVAFGPPALPVYEQPLCPGPGYIWTPGYWAYGPDGYFWVPGTWVVAPEPGLLWTPGYWGWGEGLYLWHPGYWGPRVGYYGGIAYGYGYTGVGYQGGYWRDRHFYYNRSVNNVNVTNVHNVYNTTVVNNYTTVNRVSYNGGQGGTTARPTPQEEAAARERHITPTTEQVRHEHTASTNRELLATANHGRPSIAATAKPAEFRGHGVVGASRAGAPYEPEANRGVAASRANTPAPRPESNARRPEIERGNEVVRPGVPHPPSAAHGENAGHAQNMPHAQNTPRLETAPRPENRPRQEAAPRREAAPHYETAPHPQAAPHRENVAHPEKGPHSPGGSEQRLR